MRWGDMAPALALPLFLATLAAPVSADHLPYELEVQDARVAEPIPPLSHPGKAHLEVLIPCRDDESATAWTTVHVLQAPGWASITSPGATNVTTRTCHDPTDTLEIRVLVEVTVRQAAPAFQQAHAQLQVTVQKNHTNGTRETLGPGRATVTFEPGYLSLYSARLDRKVVQAGPQEAATYPILLENEGNAITRFEFAVLNADTLPAGFKAVQPEPLVLRPNQTGTATFQVYTPFHNGYVNEVGAIQLEVTPMYAEDTTLQGEPTQLSTLTQAKGWYVPGPGPWITLLAISALAVAMGARRRST
ncbi:MAG: hypothetical protein R3185_01090 [Candidatus Thermoplasmatota archaeon]|nr:hypothetical protein [Candidatus Thermoplasmatota archaeon]